MWGKVGAALIITGFLIPLILLLFFGGRWIPSRQSGIIFSIMNANLNFYESEYLKETKENKYDLERYSEKQKEEKFTIPFRYVVGGGLISVVLGSFIFIKEMK